MFTRCAFLFVATALGVGWPGLAGADSSLRSANGAVVLEGGQALPASGSRMEDATGTRVLLRAAVGEVGAGVGETAGGVVLTAGTLKVPEPNPLLLGLSAGLTLLSLARGRRVSIAASRWFS